MILKLKGRALREGDIVIEEHDNYKCEKRDNRLLLVGQQQIILGWRKMYHCELVKDNQIYTVERY